MSKLSEWVKENKKEACEDCSSKESLKVLRSGRTLCIKCYYKHYNKGRVPGKRKPRPLTPTSHKSKLWAEIERLRGLAEPQTHGEEMRTLHD